MRKKLLDPTSGSARTTDTTLAPRLRSLRSLRGLTAGLLENTKPNAAGLLSSVARDLERAGVPAVSICTDSFRVPAQAMARAYGFPGLEFVTTPHPIARLGQAQLQPPAAGLLPGKLRVLGAES